MFIVLSVQVLRTELVVTAGAVAGILIAGLCRPTAFAAYNITNTELLGAAFIAEFTGIHRTAEAGPAGGG